MNEKIDLAKMTDITALKALAYDQLALLEATQANIRAINQRMSEVVNASKEDTKREVNDTPKSE